MTAMKLERVGYIPSYAERKVVGCGQFCHIFNGTTLITLMFDKRCKKVVEAVAKLRITVNVCAVGELKPLHYQNGNNLIKRNTDEYTTEPTIA